MSKREDVKKILIIGSGPIIIGQACEFDYSGTQPDNSVRVLFCIINVILRNTSICYVCVKCVDACGKTAASLYMCPVSYTHLDVYKRQISD